MWDCIQVVQGVGHRRLPFIESFWKPLLVRVLKEWSVATTTEILGTITSQTFDGTLEVQIKWIPFVTERSPKGLPITGQKLKPEDIPDIRKRIASGESLSSIGRLYKVATIAISCIRDGITWKHVT